LGGGADQQHAFDDIKKYLSSPPVMKAPMARIPFRIYSVVEDAIIGVVLTQVMDGKEHIITYLSWCLIDIKKGIQSLKSYAYLCFMLVPNYDITCYLVLI
jgi:hypothetical protein